MPRPAGLDPAILIAGGSVLIRGQEMRLGIITQVCGDIQVQYYDIYTGEMAEEGEVRVRRQGAWERAMLLTTRQGRHEGDKVKLCTTSPEEPAGETDRFKPANIDKRRFAPFSTHTNTWADPQHVWRAKAGTGRHDRYSLARIRMGWGKDGKDAAYLVQQGLDIPAILRLENREEDGAGKKLEPRTLGLDRGTAAVADAEEIPRLLKQWEGMGGEGQGGRSQAFSDGSKKATRGTYGWLATVEGRLLTGGGVCSLCWGGLDSYRTESYGILSVLVALHRHAHRGLTIWCDNSAVVRVVERLQLGGKIPKRCSDIWTEIQQWLGRWGDRVDVQWTRGHVEKRKKKEDWTPTDWGNYLSDLVAEAMYVEARNSQDPAQSLPCSGRWRLWEKEHPASGNLYDMALRRLSENHIDDYMIQHEMGAVTREHWEYTTMGLGYTGSHAPHLRGMNVQRLFSKNRTQEELRHQGSCGSKSEAVKAAMQQEHCALCKSKEDT